MDMESRKMLVYLIRTQRVAALGTLRDGAPFVSLTPFSPAVDFSFFSIHISRLAHHTRNILADSRVSLMIAETDTGERDPLTLARVSIQGRAVEVPATGSDYEGIKFSYLTRHPQSAVNFQFGDFALFSIRVRTARYVAGFGKIFDLTIEDFTRTSIEK